MAPLDGRAFLGSDGLQNPHNDVFPLLARSGREVSPDGRLAILAPEPRYCALGLWRPRLSHSQAVQGSEVGGIELGAAVLALDSDAVAARLADVPDIIAVPGLEPVKVKGPGAGH